MQAEGAELAGEGLELRTPTRGEGGEGDLRGGAPKLDQECVIERREKDVRTSGGRCEGGLGQTLRIGEAPLQFDIHWTAGGEAGQGLVERRQRRALVWVLGMAQDEPAEVFAPGALDHEVGSAAEPAEILVVKDDECSIRGRLDVDLDQIRPLGDRELERGKGVLESWQRSAMGGDPGWGGKSHGRASSCGRVSRGKSRGVGRGCGRVGANTLAAASDKEG